VCPGQCPGGGGIAVLGDSLRRRHGAGDEPPPKRPEMPRPRRPGRSGGRFHFEWWQWALAAVVILGGSFIVGYLLSTQVLFPRPDTAGAGVEVPSLYGDMQGRAESEVREAGLEVGRVTELASMEAERGRVLAQDPIPGQLLHRGAAVSFAISAGPPELRVPPLRGMHVSTARELLESVGFAVEVRHEESSSIPEGIVTRTDPSEGVARPLPAAVVLLVSAGPPVAPVPESAEPEGVRVRPIGELQPRGGGGGPPDGGGRR